MALVTSTDANMSERVRYGQVLGADFILTGKIDVKTIKQEEVNPLTGQKNVTYSTLSDVTFNMIEIKFETETISVLDVITFNDDNKIISIRAYKG